MKTVLIGVAVLLIATGILFTFNSIQTTDTTVVTVTSFEECVAAGNPVMESYPRQCRSADGQLFVEEVPPQTSDDGFGLQANGCAVAGCSGTLCVSADEAGDIVTTCEYRPEYACYKEASCEPQANGQCGWTDTPQLRACLNNPPQFEDGGIPQAY
ncbi:hypothetical protein C4585_01675 [Candidatus Parcubacteria bacterium]|nr:MAG: hypothetical protein C4585_01675 [Candidatus Parcubacteria bacterium]